MPELATPAVVTGAPPGRLSEFWRSYAQSRGALVGLALVVLLVLLAFFADVISPHPPNEQYREFTLTPPAWDDGGTTKKQRKPIRSTPCAIWPRFPSQLRPAQMSDGSSERRLARWKIGGTLGMIHVRLFASDEPLVDLVNPLMGMVVLPYLGEAAALRELTRPRGEDQGPTPGAWQAGDGGRSTAGTHERPRT